MITTYFVVALVSYLLGSIPFGYILVKLFLRQDIRQTGSGNIGATNVARSGAKGLAIATLLLDAGKGAIAVGITIPLALRIYGPSYLGAQFRAYSGPASAVTHDITMGAVLLTLSAFAVICGHIFPVWLRFRGGKGVATAIGAFLVLAPTAALVSIAVFVLVVSLTRYVSAGSIIASAVFPSVWWFASAGQLLGGNIVRPDGRVIIGAMATSTGRIVCVLFIVASSTLIILKHRDNIRRLLAGTEHKFGTPKVPADPIQAEKNA